VGLIAGSGAGDAERAAARKFAAAWQQGDYQSMYELADAGTRERTSYETFAGDYRAAAATATLSGLRAGRPGPLRDGVIRIPITARTKAFGSLAQTVALPVHDGHVGWSADLAFPGLRAGETLTARLRAPPRAALLARDGTPLAKGATRASPLGPVATEIVGSVGPAPVEQREERRARGLPPNGKVGISGLERIFESRLSGTGGGELRAGTRVLARSTPRAARPVRTSISPSLERASIAALAGRFGGVAAIDPRTGEVLALAGLAFSALQPPGSTFKIITVTAALESGATSLKSSYPVRTGAVLDGRTLSNANGESCGGTLLHSFAESCNSVFAPLGARVGGRRLVATAERYGFNRPTGIAGSPTSSIPPAAELKGDLDLGASAIGQGRVQATALQMTTVAATIAERGRRPRPTLAYRPTAELDRVTSPRVARTVTRLMRAVVQTGTGTAAQIPGVAVAGKTGTAELGGAVDASGQQTAGGTDAWFVAFAPAARARIAVGVLLVKAGAGGQAAAPVAKQVLQAALHR
jgi:cell division protein FtsI/penicillin-binding protein 2